MDERDTIQVSVCYAGKDKQILIPTILVKNSSVSKAIQASGILEKVPEIDLAINSIGIFGKLVELNFIVSNHDRVEIYRELSVDPMQARRNRQQAQNK